MTTAPPTEPCYVIFKGARHIQSALYEHINEPIEIVEYTNGSVKELAVMMIGRREKFPLVKFHGEWQVIELERIAV